MERGVVTGRFEPFHNGHLEFVCGAKERCNFLTILVGELPDFEKGTAARSFQNAVRVIQHGFARDRSDPNPFSFEERKRMIEGSLAGVGIRRGEFEVRRLSLRELLRTDGAIYLNRPMGPGALSLTKRMLLGLMLRDWETLDAARHKTKEGSEISGQFIREQIKKGAPISDCVPAASQKIISEHFSRRAVKITSA